MRKFEGTKTVDDIEVIKTRGPWQTKSGGELNVLFALGGQRLREFLDFDNPEFDEIPGDMRGLRSYTVTGIPEGSIGGTEWHRARTEYIRACGGSALWQCVDLAGGEREFELDGETAVAMPPGILHTYRALEDNTGLQVVANTLFVPEDPRTHDTYSLESFYALQAERLAAI
jgi:hypothetical protein